MIYKYSEDNLIEQIAIGLFCEYFDRDSTLNC